VAFRKKKYTALVIKESLTIEDEGGTVLLRVGNQQPCMPLGITTQKTVLLDNTAMINSVLIPTKLKK
jgi:hypothetical protein